MKARTLRPVAIARGARINVALLALLFIAFFTGWIAFAFATAPARWSLDVHAAGGLAILALLPWKSMIARRGLDRPRAGRWASILLGILVLITLIAGALHSTGLLVYWGPLSAMEVHVGGTCSLDVSAFDRLTSRGATSFVRVPSPSERPPPMPGPRCWSGQAVCPARYAVSPVRTRPLHSNRTECRSAPGCSMRFHRSNRAHGGCLPEGANGLMTSSSASTIV